MSTLVIAPALGSPQAPPTTATLTVGSLATQQASASAALLPTGRTGGVVAVVPVRALSWQRVTLPRALARPAAARRARQPAGRAAARRPGPAALCPAAGAQSGSPIWVAHATAPGCARPAGGAGGRGPPGRSRGAGFAPGPTASGREGMRGAGPAEDAYAVLTGHGAQQAVAVRRWRPPGALFNRHRAMKMKTLPVRAEPAVAALAERLLGRPVQLRTASQRA